MYDNGTYENKVTMFKDAAKLINVPLEDCLIIGDSKSGITNAYVAGCKNIIVVILQIKKVNMKNYQV